MEEQLIKPCGCEQDLSDEARFGMLSNTPCDSISVELLRVYLQPINCYLQYLLWSQIGITQTELESCKTFLEDFISRKEIDINNCTGVENLISIRKVVTLILNKGACL